MAPRFLTILTGRNLPKIQQAREPEPSTINEQTIADFAREVSRPKFQSGLPIAHRLLKRCPGPQALGASRPRDLAR